MTPRSILASALILLSALGGCRDKTASPLPSLGVRLEGVSVSGFSAGGYMAGQMHMAHARLVTGVGLVGGGPYGCALSTYSSGIPTPGLALINAARAIHGCMRHDLAALGVPDAAALAEEARRLAKAAAIDPIEAASRGRAYVFSGSRDETVVPAIGATARQFYEQIGMAPGAIKHVTDIEAGHAFVTTDQGAACAATEPPYINNCGYDQAGEILAHLIGPLSAVGAMSQVDVAVFDQTAFSRELTNHGLAAEGTVLIPHDCRAAPGCRLHVVFHGCRQSTAGAGSSFPLQSGFGRWAASNRLVVLFPQVAASAVNPYGCWDWWGYSGSEFLTRKAPQIMAVRRMIDRLAAR